jgi:hypothetical protein
MLEEIKKEESNPQLQRKILKFSPQAEEMWLTISDEIEIEKRPGGRFEKATDHASKLPVNIARVAALLHFFEGFDGDISVETLYVAIEICRDCSNDFMKLFVKPPEEFSDAQILLERFDVYRERGCRYIEKNFARRRCPNLLRTNGRFYVALDRLYFDGYVAARFDLKDVEFIDLYPGQKDLPGFYFVN